MLTYSPETVLQTCVVKSFVFVHFVSPALTASAASKVPKPGFGFDWKTGGALYKP